MSNRLAVILEEKQVRQDQISSALGVTAATISRWCSNISQPSLDKLYMLASILKVDLSELTYGDTKVVSFKGTLDLSVVASRDVFLEMVMGSKDLLSLQKAVFFFKSEFPDGSTISYPLTLFGYMSLDRPTHISIIEVGEIITNCKFTKLTVENCDETLHVTFRCPSNKKISA